MTARVTPFVTPQEQRIEDYRQKIDARRKEIIRLSFERQAVEEDVASFEREYGAKVGRLYVELDRVKLEIKELLYRARLIEKGHARDETHLDKRVDRAFRVERRQVQERRATEREDEQPENAERERTPAPNDPLRRLYLRLAKTYHPDKAADPDDQDERKRIMALINDAYDAGDLNRLRRLASTLEDGSAAADEKPNETERRLYREFLKLDRAAREIEREIERFKSRETYRLKVSVEEAQERGEDMLGDLRRDLETKIVAAKGRLNLIRDQLKTLVGQFFGG